MAPANILLHWMCHPPPPPVNPLCTPFFQLYFPALEIPPLFNRNKSLHQASPQHSEDNDPDQLPQLPQLENIFCELHMPNPTWNSTPVATTTPGTKVIDGNNIAATLSQLRVWDEWDTNFVPKGWASEYCTTSDMLPWYHTLLQMFTMFLGVRTMKGDGKDNMNFR